MVSSTTSTADFNDFGTDVTSTTDSEYYDVTSTADSDSWYIISYGYKEKDFKGEERLFKLAEKEELMKGWSPKKQELRSLKRKPIIQLRGVRFDGRGWA